MEDKRYCIWCGKELDSFVSVCPVCGASLDEKENLLKDWLYRNTKESLKGKIDDTMFTVVKNWLLCHLYGVIVAVTIIASALLASRNSLPGYVGRTALTVGPGSRHHGQRVDKDILNAIYSRTLDYKQSCSRHQAAREGIQLGHRDLSEFPAPETFWPPARLPAGGRHEYTVHFEVGSHASELETESYTYDRPKTRTGKALKERGYTVAEIIHVIQYYEDEVFESPVILTERYMVVLVEIGGTWYIAEDALMQ